MEMSWTIASGRFGGFGREDEEHDCQLPRPHFQRVKGGFTYE
jgi:hypothetical protein